MAENRKEPMNSGRVYDDIYNYVQSFGPYQKLLFGLINLLTFPIESQFSALVFVVGIPDFHCTTANVTCPAKQCCDGCKSYAFDGPFSSIVSTWNLICDRAYLAATVNSCFFAGMLVGSLTTGMLSDGWGRKKCIFISNSVMLIAGVASSFVDCIELFAFLRFIVGFGQAGVMLSLVIYCMELVGPKYRTASGNLAILGYIVCSLICCFISYLAPKWRIYLLIGTVPAMLLFPFWKWIPESPRWLVAHNRLDEALEAIQKYGGKMTNTPIATEDLRNLLTEIRRDQIDKAKEDKKYSILDLFRTPRLRKRTAIVCYQWFAVSVVFFGVLLSFTQFSGNIYVNYAIMKGLLLLRTPVAWATFLKFGRRIPHATFMIIAAVSYLLILCLYKKFPLAATALSLLGYLFIGCCWVGNIIITSELFPTLLRNTAQGIGSTAARIGGMLVPYIAMMGQLPGLGIAFPVGIFGVIALIAGVLMYWIPETLNTPMGQTIEEVETVEEDFGIRCCRKRPITRDEYELENMIEKNTSTDNSIS